MFEFKLRKLFSNYKVQCISILKLKITTAGCLSTILFYFVLI